MTTTLEERIGSATVRQVYEALKRASISSANLGLAGKYTDAPGAELRTRLAWVAGKACETRRRAIHDGLTDAGSASYVGMLPLPAYAGPGGAAAVPAPVAPAAPAVQGEDDDAAAAIAAAIRRLAVGAAPAVDLETVRAVVREEVAAATLPRPVSIQVADRPPVDVGHAHAKLPLLVSALAAGVNVWLAGPAGSGKSHAARQAAAALGVEYFELPALESAAQVTGYRDAAGEWRMPPLRSAWEGGGLVLLDEVAGADPRATLALFGGLSSGWLAFADSVVKRHPQCYVVAADNTAGYGGTAAFSARGRQDAAFIDRFAPLAWDYCADLERALVPAPWHAVMLAARKWATERKVDRVQVGTRTGQRAATLAAAGWPTDETLASCWRGGLTDAQWSELRPILAGAVKGAGHAS